MSKKQKINLCICITIILTLIIFSTIFLIKNIEKEYKIRMYNYTNQVISKIIEEYPEQEEKVIKEFLTNDNNYEDILKNMDLMKKILI